MSEVLRLAEIGKSYQGIGVLEGVSLSLGQGERLAVIGHSGSGKTTLLRLIAGLEPPTHGDISIAGRAASRAGEVLIAPERREVALVFQGLALFPHLRALDQIAFAARGRGGIRQAKHLLDRIGLGHRATARLDELSGGQRQRIALARALAQEPRLLLMDEPFLSLDDQTRAEMRDLLRSLLLSTLTTLILVTHSREDALDLAQRVVILEEGRAVVQDALETVLAHPQHAAAVRTLGLGHTIEAQVTSAGDVVTAFGRVSTRDQLRSGPARLLVRPAQLRMTSNGDGVEAEVVSVQSCPTETRDVRRIAVVRVHGKLLRVLAVDRGISSGDRIRVRIDGDCEPVVG